MRRGQGLIYFVVDDTAAIDKPSSPSARLQAADVLREKFAAVGWGPGVEQAPLLVREEGGRRLSAQPVIFDGEVPARTRREATRQLKAAMENTADVIVPVEADGGQSLPGRRVVVGPVAAESLPAAMMRRAKRAAASISMPTPIPARAIAQVVQGAHSRR